MLKQPNITEKFLRVSTDARRILDLIDSGHINVHELRAFLQSLVSPAAKPTSDAFAKHLNQIRCKVK